MHLTEGGGGGSFVEASRLSGDEFRRALRAGDGPHRRGRDPARAAAGARLRPDVGARRADLALAQRLLREYMIQHLRVRNEIYGNPLGEERLAAIEREIEPWELPMPVEAPGLTSGGTWRRARRRAGDTRAARRAARRPAAPAGEQAARAAPRSARRRTRPRVPRHSRDRGRGAVRPRRSRGHASPTPARRRRSCVHFVADALGLYRQYGLEASGWRPACRVNSPG